MRSGPPIPRPSLLARAGRWRRNRSLTPAAGDGGGHCKVPDSADDGSGHAGPRARRCSAVLRIIVHKYYSHAVSGRASVNKATNGSIFSRSLRVGTMKVDAVVMPRAASGAFRIATSSIYSSLWEEAVRADIHASPANDRMWGNVHGIEHFGQTLLRLSRVIRCD
jgi:hypothetical protein